MKIKLIKTFPSPFLKERARERIIFKTLTPNPLPQGEGE